jgi:hypothetical protein
VSLTVKEKFAATPRQEGEDMLDYAIRVCGTWEEAVRLCEAKALPADVQQAVEADEAAARQDEIDETIENLGSAKKLYDWLEVQGAAMTCKQITAYFERRSRRTVLYWLKTLDEAGLLITDDSDYHRLTYRVQRRAKDGRFK